MHIVSTLANDRFLKLEEVLSQNIGDVLSYLTYLSEKSEAEEAQYNFQKKLNDAKRK
jgi:hypothetical protein